MPRLLPALILGAFAAGPLAAQNPSPQALVARAAPPGSPGEVRRAVQSLLAAPLDAEAAVRLAFLNNPRVQAARADLDIAAADLRAAGLLPNPTLGATARRGSEGTKTEFSLGQEVVSLFTRGLRRRVATRELDAARLETAASLQELEVAVREAFLDAQGAEQELALHRATLESAEAALELARRQRAAGNINQLALDAQAAAEAQARLDLARAELRREEAREALDRLMGLSGPDTAWKLEAPLPPLPERDPGSGDLEAWAVAHRFDLELARRNREVVADALRLARRTRFFGAVTLGAATEKDPGGQRLTGPFLELELPLFDRGQARAARLEAEGRRAEASYAALEVEARSQVREARARLAAARAEALAYRDTLLPLRERVVAETQKHYDAMLLSVYDLLRAEQERLDTARAYLGALRAYWTARLALQRALGGAFPEDSK